MKEATMAARPERYSRKSKSPKRVVRILNCEPSVSPETDWTIENATDAGVLAAAPIPTSKDLREVWWKIGD
jgi:hypothetical protein